MLPADARLRRSRDFAAVLRRGAGTRRASRARLVAHLALPAVSSAHRRPARAGFAVSTAVGGAVVRNRVKRRLRAAAAGQLHRLPAGSDLVVRASPAAARATYAELAGDLDAALTRLLAGGRS